MAYFLIVVAVLSLLSCFGVALAGQEGKVKSNVALWVVPLLFALTIVAGSVATQQIAASVLTYHV